jgi:hypothetical protein
MIDHSVLCSSQEHLKTVTRDLYHPIVVGAENTDIIFVPIKLDRCT